MNIRQFDREDGNVSILLIGFCMGITLLMVLFLDFYTALYTRHATQTAADGAVLGALRVAQRVLTPVLAERAESKIREWEQETNDEYERLQQEWVEARDLACPEEPEEESSDGTSEESPTEITEEPSEESPEEPLPPQEPPREECLEQWEQEHPAPVLEEIQRKFLDERVSEPAVVNAILYGEGVVETRMFVESVLSTQEVLCALRDARSDIHNAAVGEASNYARWNRAELTSLVVPYQDLPQIMVRVERPVPTLVLGRYGNDKLRAERVALATLVSVKHVEPIPDACP